MREKLKDGFVLKNCKYEHYHASERDEILASIQNKETTSKLMNEFGRKHVQICVSVTIVSKQHIAVKRG